MQPLYQVGDRCARCIADCGWRCGILATTFSYGGITNRRIDIPGNDAQLSSEYEIGRRHSLSPTPLSVENEAGWYSLPCSLSALPCLLHEGHVVPLFRPLVLSSCIVFYIYCNYLLILGCKRVFEDVFLAASIMDLGTKCLGPHDEAEPRLFKR